MTNILLIALAIIGGIVSIVGAVVIFHKSKKCRLK